MTDSDKNPFLISPPPGLIPAAKHETPAPAAPVIAPHDLIGLPPGIAESATHRVAPGPTPVVAPTPVRAPAPVAFPASAPPVTSAAAAPTTETPVAPVAPAVTPVDATTPAVPALVFPDGARVALSSTTLLGRDPAATGEWVGAALVPVVDPGKSVSKTHAAVTVEQGGIRIHDLNSTNGTVVLRQGGGVDSVQPGASLVIAPGDSVSLGQFSVLLSG